MCGYLPSTSLCKIGVFFIEMKQEQQAGLSSLANVVKESAVKPGMNQAMHSCNCQLPTQNSQE